MQERVQNTKDDSKKNQSATDSTEGEAIANFTSAFSRLRESQRKLSEFLEESELAELKLAEKVDG